MIIVAGLVAGLVLLGLGLRARADPRRLSLRRAASIALGDTAATRFGRRLAAALAAQPGRTGVYLVDDPVEAYAARAQLIRGADAGVDIQCYIWQPDVAGMLLLAELQAAAQRGVRVRLLLDDNGTGGLDPMLRLLDAEPRIEVRLFNPFVIRWPKLIGYLLDFRRLNRRMHNKSLTADNQLTIVGGRNVGDTYLGAGAKLLFADLDVLAAGAVVPAVAADFERYWASGSAYPAASVLGVADADDTADFAEAVAAARATPLAARYAEAATSGLVDRLLADPDELEWAAVTLVSDDPAKGLDRARNQGLLAIRLAAIIGKPHRELGLVAAYFVPTRAMETLLANLAADGVAVDVLTNALKANDVAIVHAGYAPSRRPLLRAGVRLWELKGSDPDRRVRLRFRGGSASGARSGIARRPGRLRRRWRLHRHGGGRHGPVFRSGRSALHAKAFTIDRQRLFVGSFNVDPRSIHLNTEMGFVIESPLLAARVQDLFGAEVAGAAYGLRLDGNRILWVEAGENGEIVHRHEPGTGPVQRLILRGLEFLPVKWLL